MLIFDSGPVRSPSGWLRSMWVPSLFSVHPPSDPGHNREFALGANTASFRLATSLQIYALTPLILGMFAL